MTQDSIKTTTVWQTDNDVVVPVTVTEEVKKEAPARVAKPRPAPVQKQVVADTVAVHADTVAVEETIVAVPGETMQGIVLVDPDAQFVPVETAAQKRPYWGDMSWIYLTLAVLFCAIGIKFKGNSRYMKALYDDLTDTRLRSNLFDETVRETSLLVLLNMMWVVNVGILLWRLVKLTAGSQMNSIHLTESDALGTAICIGVTAVYLGLIYFAYWVIGNVFSDRRHTQLWVKGATASTGMGVLILLPVSVLALIYPQWTEILLLIAGGTFVVGKCMFLYKGFRIFFNEISSWLLFLYYLCSLEIVPLILAYTGAVVACASWQ